jgi:hypothetical protein
MEIATMHDMSNTRKEIAARLGFAAGNSAKAKFGRFDTELKFLDFQIMQQPDLARKNVIALAEKMGANPNITKDEMDGLMRAAKWLKMESQVKKAYEDSRSAGEMSRSGAKAKFGRAEDVYRLLETTPSSYNNAKKLDALATEAMRLADITPAGKDVSLHELAEMVGQDLEGDRSRASRPGAKTRMTRDQTEEQKAGLKIMSAACPAVGAKIAKLIKEGKPQDQAVAIALDMKRRGEL